MIVGSLALMTTSGFAVACAYINLVEQPARLPLPAAALLAQWRVSYHRGTAMQLPLAIVSAVLAVASWIISRNLLWLGGAACLLAIAPYTLLVVMPVNRALSASTAAQAGGQVAALMRSWGRRHAVRGVLGFAAALFFLAALG